MDNHSSWQSNPLLRSYPRVMVLVGFILLTGSFVVYWINPARSFLTQMGISVAIGLFLLAILLRPNIVHRIFSGGAAREFSEVIVTSLAVVAVLAYANFISLENNFELDLTETGRFTLSEQTIEVLENLSEPVQIIGFFKTGGHRWTIAKDYLERYSQYTDLISYKLYDPTLKPELAESYDLGNYGLIFINGVYRFQTHKVKEESITTGVMCVTTHRHKKPDKSLITIEHPQPSNHDIFLTPLQTGLTFFITLIFIPLSILSVGGWLWLVRQ